MLIFFSACSLLRVVPVVKQFVRKSYISQKSAVELKQDLLEFCRDVTRGYEVRAPPRGSADAIP